MKYSEATRKELLSLLLCVASQKHIGIGLYGLIFSLNQGGELFGLTIPVVAEKLHCSRQAISKRKKEWDNLLS